MPGFPFPRMADIPFDNTIVFGACLCCHDGMYLELPGCLGCYVQQECLCIKEQFCLKIGAIPFGPGCKTGDGNICELALYCCAIALKIPSTLCKAKNHCCCFIVQGALPCDAS